LYSCTGCQPDQRACRQRRLSLPSFLWTNLQALAEKVGTCTGGENVTVRVRVEGIELVASVKGRVVVRCRSWIVRWMWFIFQNLLNGVTEN
jgi:hypothetical protein